MINLITVRFNLSGIDAQSAAVQQMSDLTQQQAAVMAFGDAFFLLTIIMASLLPLV